MDTYVRHQMANDKNISYETAFEEVVASSCEKMFVDGNLEEKLKTAKGSWVKTFIDWIKSIKTKLQNWYKKLDPTSFEAEAVSKDIELFNGLQEKFAAGLEGIAEMEVTNDAKITNSKGVKLQARQIIQNTVHKAIENKGDIGEKYNQKKILPVSKELSEKVKRASGGLIDIASKYSAINGDDIYHEYIRHSNEYNEKGRKQIPLTETDIVAAIEAVEDADVYETIFADKNNPTQRLSFAYAKKPNGSDAGYYVVIEVVGGNRNPNIVPVEIIRITDEKWDRYIGSGKTIGEMVYENDTRKRQALDVEFIKKNRVTVAKPAPNGPFPSPRSPQFDTSISQDNNKNKNQTQKQIDALVFGDNATSVENDIAESTNKNQLREAPKRGMAAIKYNNSNNRVNSAVLAAGVDTMMEMAETMLPYLEEDGILPPDIEGNTILKNGSYGRTGENTTLCVRTLTYEDFKDRVAEKLGRPLTVAESLLVSQKIYDIAIDPQCIYCYVAADRKAYDEYIGEYQKQMDEYVTRLKAGENSAELYEEYLDGRDSTKAQEKRWRSWEALAKNGKQYISAKDISSRAKRNALIEAGGAIAEQVKDAQRYAQSASWAKKVLDYRAYNGSILKMSQNIVDQLNNEYGFRMYSFSDFTPAFIVENMQMIIDASVRGLKSLAYTKDTDYVKIFAKTGQAINVSCFAKYDHAAKTYVEDNRQGAVWSETKALREQYNNVGAVMVCTNDDMVEWALNQDWVDVVIPYHIVKTGTKIANEYQWRNFTAESKDTVQGSNRKADIYPTEHNNDFNLFKKLIEERNLTPRFEKYYTMAIDGKITGEQYMKLVNEVRLPANRLLPVLPDFDIDAARESFGVTKEGDVIKGGFVDKGGYMGGWYREGVDVNQEVSIVAEDIAEGKSSLDVSYGMNSELKTKQAEKYGVSASNPDIRYEKRRSKFSQALSSEEYARVRTAIKNNHKGVLIDDCAVRIVDYNNTDNTKIVCYNKTSDGYDFEITDVYLIENYDYDIFSKSKDPAITIAKGVKNGYTDRSIKNLLSHDKYNDGYVFRRYSSQDGNFVALEGANSKTSRIFSEGESTGRGVSSSTGSDSIKKQQRTSWKQEILETAEPKGSAEERNLAEYRKYKAIETEQREILDQLDEQLKKDPKNSKIKSDIRVAKNRISVAEGAIKRAEKNLSNLVERESVRYIVENPEKGRDVLRTLRKEMRAEQDEKIQAVTEKYRQQKFYETPQME